MLVVEPSKDRQLHLSVGEVVKDLDIEKFGTKP